ncbi:LysR family transcriptional regulator [Vibrio sinaloensis]|uniref:LysR family transcriptional regulator n=1 Tax=Photobacterium sp. (strain ATCC 43367) TaxID=379097 RepID=UPI00204AAD51|nr:LysR family transcriptional regulator [Vibrio sinaloensis]UPQ88867.1 LysR family transcriptional regulator [Vibrio sinaloensis]
MAYTFEQVRAFAAVVEYGGMAQAARALHKHVSTVRDLITNLENETGLILFERKARSLSLTPQGRELYNHAKALLTEYRQFDQSVDSLLNDSPSRITLAVDESLRNFVTPELTKQMAETFSGMRIKVLIGDTLQIRGWLMTGAADVGFGYSTFHYPLEIFSQDIFEFVVKTVIGAQVDITGVSRREHLKQLPQIAYSFIADSGLRSRDVIGSQVMLANSPESMLAFVRAGLGFANLSEWHCRPYLEDGSVVELDLGENVNTWSADVLCRASEQALPHITQLMDLVKHSVKQ